MIIRTQKLQELLDKRGLTRQAFASKIGVNVCEVDKMLAGESIDYDTAKKFICFFKATRAQHLIDWNKLGIENPLLDDSIENYMEDKE